VRRRLAASGAPLPVAEDRVELWAFVDSGKSVASRGRGGRVSTLPDGRHVFSEVARRGRPAVVCAVIEARPFRRILYAVAQGDRVVCFHKDVPP